MNILITGSTGFIGRNLTEELSNKKHNIFCLVRNKKRAKILEPFGVRFIYADITKAESLHKILDYRIDVIFHCAGYVKNKNWRNLHAVNVLGTENICKISLKLNIERLIYLSSVAVVTGNNRVPLVEDLPYKATNIYGESKIEAEKKVLEYRKKGLRAVILRPCIVYGEGEPHLFKRLLFLLNYRLLPVIDGGRAKLHLVYVKNVIEAMMFSLYKEESLKDAFFVADEEVLTVKEIYTILSKAINAKPPWEPRSLFRLLLLNLPYVGKRLNFFLKDRVYSIEKMKSLGFKPPYLIEPSLIKSAQSFR